jgi:hypothetical protein
VIRCRYFADLRRANSKNGNNAKKADGAPPAGELAAEIAYAHAAYLLLKLWMPSNVKKVQKIIEREF